MGRATGWASAEEMQQRDCGEWFQGAGQECRSVDDSRVRRFDVTEARGCTEGRLACYYPLSGLRSIIRLSRIAFISSSLNWRSSKCSTSSVCRG